MALRFCTHPACVRSTNRNWCGFHWGSLPDDFKRRYRAAKSREEKGALLVEAENYFRERMVGQHEITKCRGKDCGADVCWMLTRSGKRVIVDAEGVEQIDTHFDRDKHVAHWASCPNADDFRRPQ